MIRYKAMFSSSYDYSSHTADTIVEEDKRPIDTGLLDSTGVKIYRVQDREPIGFLIMAKK